MAAKKNRKTGNSRAAPRIDIGDLSEVVTAAVQRVIDARGAVSPESEWPPWRITIGLILEGNHDTAQLNRKPSES